MTALDYDYTLEDKYLKASGCIFITGTEALVRLPLLERLERQDIEDFPALAERLAKGLTSGNRGIAVSLAALAMQIRGYGHIKDGNRARVGQEQAELLRAFDAPERAKAA